MNLALRLLRSYAKIPPLLECGMVIGAIVVQIWIFDRSTNLGTYLAGTLVVIGFAARKAAFGEGLKELGLIRARYLIPPAIAYAIQIIFRHQLSHLFHNVQGPKKMALDLLAYLSWGIAQQLILNGFFVRRLQNAGVRKTFIPLVAGEIFGIFHLPNPVLTPATIAGGILASYVFLRMKKKNIYAIGIVHGIVGTVLLYSFPLSLTHHFAVGPAYYRWK